MSMWQAKCRPGATIFTSVNEPQCTDNERSRSPSPRRIPIVCAGEKLSTKRKVAEEANFIWTRSPSPPCAGDLDQSSSSDSSPPPSYTYEYASIVDVSSVETILQSDVEDDLDEENEDELDNLIEHLGTKIGLPYYIQMVAPYTNDNGKYLIEVMNEDLHNFSRFVQKVYDKKTTDKGDILARKHFSLKERYERWTQLMQQRKDRELMKLIDLVPYFDWEEYDSNESYLENYFIAVMSPEQCGETPEKEDLNAKHFGTIHSMMFLENETRKLQDDLNCMMETLNELREDKIDRQSEQQREQEYLQYKNQKLMAKLKRLQEKRHRLKQEMKCLLIQSPTDSEGYELDDCSC